MIEEEEFFPSDFWRVLNPLKVGSGLDFVTKVICRGDFQDEALYKHHYRVGTFEGTPLWWQWVLVHVQYC